MRLTALTVMCLTLLLLTPAPKSARGDDPIDCGWVETIQCPGCDPLYPADSTCGCNENRNSCDCVKQSRGVQTGSIITCNEADFDYRAGHGGYVITRGDETWCKKVKKCVHGGEGGGSLDCSDPNDCPGEGSCGWVVKTTTNQGTYVQTASCSGDPAE